MNIFSAAGTSLVMLELLITVACLFRLFGASLTAPYVQCAIQHGSNANGTVVIKRLTHLNIASGNPYMVKFASMNQIIQMKTNEVRKCVILLTIGFLVTLQVLVVVF